MMTNQTKLTPAKLNKRLGIKGEYALMMWNATNRSQRTGTFAFVPTLEAAKRRADEYVAYLAENQVQVSKTGVYPIEVVYRLWNHGGKVVTL